jgi:hypothetical protein
MGIREKEEADEVDSAAFLSLSLRYAYFLADPSVYPRFPCTSPLTRVGTESEEAEGSREERPARLERRRGRQTARRHRTVRPILSLLLSLSLLFVHVSYNRLLVAVPVYVHVPIPVLVPVSLHLLLYSSRSQDRRHVLDRRAEPSGHRACACRAVAAVGIPQEARVGADHWLAR